MKMELPIKFMTLSGAVITAAKVAEFCYNYAITNWHLFELILKMSPLF